MHAELPIISLILAALLAAYIPIKRVRRNVASMAIVLWLFACNVIHGINAIQWAGNVDTTSPVWCDIATGVVLAAYVALPSACICMSRGLEQISSQRKMLTDRHSIWIRTLTDILICYNIPVIYLALHYIPQSHRFDIIKDYGCFASIYPSEHASFIIYLPPALLCSIAMTLSGLTIHNLLRQRPYADQHIQNRSSMTLSQFYRCLMISSTMTVALIICLVLLVVFMPMLEPWTSLAEVHAHITDINIVKVPSQITFIQRSWWLITAISIIYLILLVTLGEETREVYRWVASRSGKSSREKAPGLLPLHLSIKPVPSHPQVLHPLTVDLRSCWFDTAEESQPSPLNIFLKSLPNISKPGRPRQNTRTPPPIPSSASPMPVSSQLSDTSHGHSPNQSLQLMSMREDDRAFMSNTLQYLRSPTGQSLGLSFPSPVHLPLTKDGPLTSPTLGSDKTELLEDKATTSRQAVTQPTGESSSRGKVGMEDAMSTISSIFGDGAWPLPPITPIPTSSSRYRAL